MDKLELRARTRGTSPADNGLLEFTPEAFLHSAEARGRSGARSRPLLAPVDPIDEGQARAACKPMGELEYIVRSVDAKGNASVLYVIVPDPALGPHYERQGFSIEPGCRMLVDATEMKAIAMLHVSARAGDQMPPVSGATAGFNPYFDIRSV